MGSDHLDREIVRSHPSHTMSRGTEGNLFKGERRGARWGAQGGARGREHGEGSTGKGARGRGAPGGRGLGKGAGTAATQYPDPDSGEPTQSPRFNFSR
jgi:hypothetical protein